MAKVLTRGREVIEEAFRHWIGVDAWNPYARDGIGKTGGDGATN